MTRFAADVLRVLSLRLETRMRRGPKIPCDIFVPQRPKAVFRAYRGSIELASNATRKRSVAKNSTCRLRIFTENIPVILRRLIDSVAQFCALHLQLDIPLATWPTVF